MSASASSAFNDVSPESARGEREDNMTIRKLLLAGAVTGLLFTGCSPADERNQSAQNAVAAKHETAIRSISKQWLGLIRNRDAAAIAKLYAPDGALLPPGAPIAVGSSAIEQAWRGMMETPGFALSFEITQIVVASAGDMAFDRGTYRFSSSGPNGPVTDTGKYVVVWRNIDGEWKAVADIFNSDAAQPAG